jgi:hypothetical protein
LADISHLSNLIPVEPLDSETYPVNRGAAFPKAGKYILQAPDSFTFGESKTGALTAKFDATIVGPASAGYKARFLSVSAKAYPRGKDQSGKTLYASQMGDYLMACGVQGTFSTPQALADADESTAGRSFEVLLDWRAYNKNNPTFQVRGMENFPLVDGQHQPWVTDPDDIDPETSEPRRVRANIEIVRFIAAR